ncbi:CMRF35-like molecule 1 isoform X1 [Salarias fasciatus]|uniref:CMRF35-like molecule 1 isoform X1 n=1 Tax=Salarias fasciatus TaxID=181472 RepID=UPI001176A1D3|nr:CMRF35-like molecule 1 isoform X1 [Salarias fasciatus]
MFYFLHSATMIDIRVQICLLSVLSIVEMKIVSVTGRVGSAVSFHCSGWDTQTDIASYDKYFCKDPCKSGKDVILTASFMKTDQTNKIQISNKGESLLVTFTDLQMSDSKTYYCGVDRFFRDNYIKVNLKVLQAVQKPAETDSVGSTVSPAVINSSNMSPSDLGGARSFFVTSSALHITTERPETQGAGLIPYLTVGLIFAITTLILLLKFMRTVKRKKKADLDLTDQPQVDAQTGAEYSEIRLEDQQTEHQSAVHFSANSNTDPNSLYANYSHLQDTELEAYCKNKHDSSVSSRPSKVTRKGSCAESRATNLDLIYCGPQFPRDAEQHETTPTGVSGNDCVYSLAQFPQTT